MAEITNIRSPRVKAARRLAKRAFRDRDRAFLAEGPQAVREALAIEDATVELFATAEAQLRHGDIVAAATAAGVPVHWASGEVMAELTQTVTPQGIVAVCRFVHVPLAEAVPPSGARLVAVLAHVRDPGNAGTVLRTADAAGADAVVFSGASVDPYNGKCVRASAGSLFHLPVATGAPVAEAVRHARESGLRVLAADGAGTRTLDEIDLGRPTAWMFGNEAWGLPAELLELADEVVRVPIYGRAESLNLATAAGICLYASARVQRKTLHSVEEPTTPRS
ncbi:TrmH family RNA methyltransferase [Sphaerimonospora mesophila]|uniref:TrmH family RNA methyltransferase n=1 Tax=Sphaerimonospora mesophila TaxID=37483 RepID=UPI0006E229AA